MRIRHTNNALLLLLLLLLAVLLLPEANAAAARGRRRRGRKLQFGPPPPGDDGMDDEYDDDDDEYDDTVDDALPGIPGGGGPPGPDGGDPPGPDGGGPPGPDGGGPPDDGSGPPPPSGFRNEEKRAPKRDNPVADGEGHYILTLVKGADCVPIKQTIADCGGTVEFQLTSFGTFIIAFGISEECLDDLLDSEDVLLAEEDTWLEQSDVQTSTATHALSWGIDRMDGAIDDSYAYDGTGDYVDVYVVDSGVLLEHEDNHDPRIALEESLVPMHGEGMPRVSCFADYYPEEGGNCIDFTGHGTHVSGTVGGLYSGVAKNVRMHMIKVLDGNGEGKVSDVVRALDDIAASRPANARVVGIINMSFSTSAFGDSITLNNAVEDAAADGLLTVAAAGNSNSGGGDACYKSPGSAPSALTVAATKDNDARASWSYYGNCVDVFAPGAAIVSASHTAINAYESRFGTSMSTAHVSGLAALYVQKYPSYTVEEIKDQIVADAEQGVVTNSNSVNNHLASTAAITAVPLQCLDKNVECDDSRQCCGGYYCQLQTNGVSKCKDSLRTRFLRWLE